MTENTIDDVVGRMLYAKKAVNAAFADEYVKHVTAAGGGVVAAKVHARKAALEARDLDDVPVYSALLDARCRLTRIFAAGRLTDELYAELMRESQTDAD